MKIFVTVLLWSFFLPFVFSQNRDHVGSGRFVKRIEYNLLMRDESYNLDSKGNIEKLFFGDFNAPVEFSYLPSSEAAFEEPPSGFRIMRSIASYILEIKHISNYKEATKEAGEKYSSIGIPLELMDVKYNNIHKLINEHNRDIHKKYYEEQHKLFKIDTHSFPISDQFAEKLYQRIVSVIDNFKAKGVPPTIFDGYSVTFRTVVEDEVWSLWIHMPKGDVLKMADLCRQIITDAHANQLDESKYITILNTFEN